MQPSTMEPNLGVKFLSAGVAACIADAATFPLDTAKVRLQIQGEGSSVVRVHTSAATGALLRHGAINGAVNGAVNAGVSEAVRNSAEFKYRGMVGTIMTICRQEGVRGLYNGLNAGLQRQMCFASIRIGLYDNVKIFYQDIFVGGPASASQMFAIRLFAGLTTGGAAVVFAQPTDVVKVRMQAQSVAAGGVKRYTGCMDAYKKIATQEGVRGLWKGVLPNVARNAVVNVSEIVCYDIIKEAILSYRLLQDGVPCHFVSAVAAGFATTVFASPVDVVKTRYMNSRPDQYRGAIDCAMRMFREGGAGAFYKGFIPNFSRFVSWNICMWLSYEQLKRLLNHNGHPHVAQV